MRVRVYWNRTRRTFSIQHRGKVIAHRDEVTLTGCAFVVLQGGWRRTVEEGRKYVHAFVEGDISAAAFERAHPEPAPVEDGTLVLYNPRVLYGRTARFYAVPYETPVPLAAAERVTCRRIDGRPRVLARNCTPDLRAMADATGAY